jgi:hypothetical protein
MRPAKARGCAAAQNQFSKNLALEWRKFRGNPEPFIILFL